MSPRAGKPMTWARTCALMATSVTALFLLGVFVFGLFWITSLGTFACFDGEEPACRDPGGDSDGIGAIRLSSWIAGAAALAALSAAFRISWRLNRGPQLIAVLALDASVIAVGLLLWSRL